MRHYQFPACLIAVVLLLTGSVACAQEELTYPEYQAIAQTAVTLHHCAMFEPVEGEPGMLLVIGDKFGKINVYRLNGGTDHDRIWASQILDGNPQEVLMADLNNDGLDDHIVCWTPSRLYAFDLENDFYLSFESQPNDYRLLTACTIFNVDEDPQKEIVIIADRKIHYVDGLSFSREWTSLNEFEAVRIRCGDVDGDNRVELVLNTGLVLDSGTGDVEWAGQVFGPRLELLDFDGDGIPEILTESPGGPLRVWDADFQAEKRFQ